MNHGSLFSGIGGFDLAAEWMGWNNVFHCEWNEFGKKVLNYYWPKSISYHDITKTDFTIHRGNIDILTGGFPCQPYSAAGKRLGKEDDRHLWPEMLRAIREIQPEWVVGENVLGLTNWNGGLVFEEVQADLEAEGYEVQPYVLPAASVNAPHRRDRVWFVAYSSDIQRDSEWEKRQQCSTRRKAQRKSNESIGSGDAANAKSGRSGGLRDEGKASGSRESDELSGGECGLSSAERPTADSTSYGGGENNRQGKSGQSHKTSAGVYWKNFPTQPPVRSGDNGFSGRLDGITFPKWRNESIKAYGNAIVPQVVYQIFKAIQTYERTKRPDRLP